MSSPTQIPDRWLLIEQGDIHKVFASWLGGYLDSDSWRMNSGIESVEVDGDYFLFHGFSGSIYKCHKDNYGTTRYGAMVLSNSELKALDGYEEYIKEAIK